MKRNRKNQKTRNRHSTKSLDFQSLEPRNLLAGFHQVPVTLPSELNLVENGDFSQFDEDNASNFFRADQVPAWQVDGLDQAHQLEYQVNLIPYQGLGRVLMLDSTGFNLDRIYQDIPTESGRDYLITFDFAAHPLSLGEGGQIQLTERTSDFEVWWNNDLIATYSAGEFWKTGSLLVTGGSGATSRLMFAEIANGPHGAGDGIGAMLNNIQVVLAAENLVANPSFEVANGDPVDGSDQNYRSHQVPGWYAIGPDLDSRLINLETLTDSQDGSRALNLNAHNGFRDAVFQELATAEEGLYFLNFFARGEQGSELRVRWNDAWATTLAPTQHWQSYGILLEADSVATQLGFVEGSAGNPSIWIDQVQLFRIDPIGTNRAPVIDQLAAQSVDFGQPVSFNINATDPEGHDFVLSLEHSGILPEMNVPTISQTGEITWTPSHAGVVGLTVIAIDSLGGRSEMSFNVEVSPFEPLSGTRALAALPPQFRNNAYSSAANDWPDGRPPMIIDVNKTYEAVFDTTAGQMTITLFPNVAPITVNNFVALANDGYYDGLVFHRVIDGFMAQGGDPLGNGTGGPGYQFTDEFEGGMTFNRSGLLAMANAGPNTNGSQFFVTFEPTTWLNNLHTIFGEVTSGTNALNSIIRTHVNSVAIPGAVPTLINSIMINES